jgi:hypothetical protein
MTRHDMRSEQQRRIYRRESAIKSPWGVEVVRANHGPGVAIGAEKLRPVKEVCAIEAEIVLNPPLVLFSVLGPVEQVAPAGKQVAGRRINA